MEGFENKSIKDSLQSMIYGQLYLPPAVKPTMVFPQFNGGTDWGGAAYDPSTDPSMSIQAMNRNGLRC